MKKGLGGGVNIPFSYIRRIRQVRLGAVTENAIKHASDLCFSRPEETQSEEREPESK
jgi:hypothetical protein